MLTFDTFTFEWILGLQKRKKATCVQLIKLSRLLIKYSDILYCDDDDSDTKS